MKIPKFNLIHAFISYFLILTLIGCADSKKMLYQIKLSSTTSSHSEIAKKYEDGTGAIVLVKNGEYPKWKPGVKTHFAYVERQSGNPNLKLWVAQEDGSNPVALTGFEIYNDYSWSPDGGWILISDSKDGNYEIYKITIDGSKNVRLTNNSYSDLYPRWSPKGNKIAYVSEVGTSNNKIFVIDANGSTPTQLTPSNINIYVSGVSQISWSPDGSQIAFIANSGTNYDVFTVDITSGQVQNITNKKSAFKYVNWYNKYIFYFEQDNLYRYNTDTKKLDPPSGLGNFKSGSEFSALTIDASDVYFSYSKDGIKPDHIYKVQHYNGNVTDLGEGMNPDIW